MALFGSLETVRRQLPPVPDFSAALQHAAAALDPADPVHHRVVRLHTDQTERIDLGGGVFALEQAYLTKPDTPEARWESHRRFIDVQIVVTGEERMDVTETRGLELDEDLTPGKDLLFYRPWGPSSRLRIGAGEVAVFFPEDAHRPSLAFGDRARVHKVVVKVPVP
jgi:YhcH/YjgK/YiaL family protein